MNIISRLEEMREDLLQMGDEVIINFPSTSPMESFLLDIDSAIAFIDDAVDSFNAIEEEA